MKTRRTMKLEDGKEVLCREDAPGRPLTCADMKEAQEKAAALGPGWLAYKGSAPEYYIARNKYIGKYEQQLLAKLANGVEVLAISGGRHGGAPRCWGGSGGLSNAKRNARALGSGWLVYQLGDAFCVARAAQFKKDGGPAYFIAPPGRA